MTVYFLKEKSQAKQKIIYYFAWLKNHSNTKPKALKVDQGSEYLQQAIVDFIRKEGMDLEVTAPYSHQQHGTAERAMRTLVELAWAMLAGRNLPVFLWEEAVSHAAYLRNRVPTRALTNATPWEMWTGEKPSVTHLQEFGVPVWVYLELHPDKMQSRARQYVFTGFADKAAAIRYYDTSTQKRKVSRNFYFQHSDPALVHDLGEPRYLIGMEITRDHRAGTVTLSQRQYILRILEKQQMTDAKPVATPIDPNVTLFKRTEAPDTCASLLYATAIGSLMYAAIGTRLDISFAVQTLSQFTQNPGPEHWIAVKRVFRYLQGTSNLSLTYGGARSWPQQILTAYTDADYASNPNDWRSILGSTYIIGGAAIGWMSKKQTVTATSTCDSEYVAAAACTRHVTWLRNLLQCLDFPQISATQIYCDNQAAISLTKDFQFHAKSKHITKAIRASDITFRMSFNR